MAIKTITATQAFQNSAGAVLASGTLILTLNTIANAQANGGGQIEPVDIVIPLTAGGLISGAPFNLWANDQLIPSNTFYIMRLYNSNGLLVAGPTNWTLSGAAPIDVSALNP
jgi:hypothetical protein